MIVFFLFLLPLCTFLSCKKTESFDPDQYPQYWELQVMTTHMVWSVSEGDQMAFRETYEFYEEGTFKKTRLQEGVTTLAEGTFEVLITEGSRYLELTFESGHEIIGSCSSSGESLWIKAPYVMEGTWHHCDGPGLIYQRINLPFHK